LVSRTGIYSCLVSRMGQIFLLSFQDGTDILLRPWRERDSREFPVSDRFPCHVYRMGHISATFPHWNILLRGFQNETDFRSRFPGQDTSDLHKIQSPCEVRG
jgi:hypothetical protein